MKVQKILRFVNVFQLYIATTVYMLGTMTRTSRSQPLLQKVLYQYLSSVVMQTH